MAAGPEELRISTRGMVRIVVVVESQEVVRHQEIKVRLRPCIQLSERWPCIDRHDTKIDDNDRPLRLFCLCHVWLYLKAADDSYIVRVEALGKRYEISASLRPHSLPSMYAKKHS